MVAAERPKDQTKILLHQGAESIYLCPLILQHHMALVSSSPRPWGLGRLRRVDLSPLKFVGA